MIPHVPLAPEILFHLAGWPVSNTQINAVIALGIFLVVGWVIRSSVKERPGRFQHAAEMALEALLSFFDQVTKDRKLSRKFFPLVGTLFLFILVSNWMGLLPGTGSLGVWHRVGEERVFFPLLRPANSDLNLTVVMAVVSVLGAHVIGVVTFGFFAHFNKFIQLGGLWRALRSFNPLKILIAIVEFAVGIIEIFSEIAKVASLSLRLFGNIFAGEVLITVIASLAAFFVPLPFMALELIVGVVQATVFSMLALVYLTILSEKPHGHEEEHHEDELGEAHGLEPHAARAS